MFFSKDQNNKRGIPGHRYTHSPRWDCLLLIVSVCAVLGWLEKPASGYRLDLALRVRLDDTLTSTDSEVGDPLQLLLTQESIKEPESMAMWRRSICRASHVLKALI